MHLIPYKYRTRYKFKFQSNAIRYLFIYLYTVFERCKKSIYYVQLLAKKKKLMKKVILASAAIAVALGACSKDKAPEFKMTASALPSEFNGTYAYIYDATDQVVDSVLVENGTFTYIAPANDTIINTLKLKDSPLLFAREAGDFTLTASTDSVSSETILTRGGDANSGFVRVQSLKDELMAIANQYDTQVRAITDIILTPDSTLTPEQYNQVDSIYLLQEADEVQLNKKYFAEANNAIIKIIALQNMRYSIPASEFVALYDQSDSSVKANVTLSKFYTKAVAAANTEVGKQFVDFSMSNPAGETKKLSDFRADGKYFLLDFFASWCGPCQRSMPVLAKLEKDYAKILTSASIAIWERDADGKDYADAVKRLKITWSTFQDGASIGADTYGVIGVPTFILFSPEGVILVRTHEVEDIQTKLAELSK